MKCPKCGNASAFRVMGFITVSRAMDFDVDENGAGVPDEGDFFDWDVLHQEDHRLSRQVECRECEHSDDVKEFGSRAALDTWAWDLENKR